MRYISVWTEIPIICIQFFGNKSSVRSYRLGIPNYPILALTMAIILFLNFLSDLTIKHIQFFCRELAVIVLFRLELILFLCIRIKEKGFGSGCRSDSISVFLCEEVFFDKFFFIVKSKTTSNSMIVWLTNDFSRFSLSAKHKFWRSESLLFHLKQTIRSTLRRRIYSFNLHLFFKYLLFYFSNLWEDASEGFVLCENFFERSYNYIMNMHYF